VIEVFSHADSAIVGFYRSLLEEAGVKTYFRNEFVSGAEVVVPVFYPAICILDPADEERALEIIRTASQPDLTPAPEWTCQSCGEVVPGSFAECWNCTNPDSEP
jgi:hypothetical protein